MNSSECHEIKDKIILESYLKMIDMDPEVLCNHLAIKDCIELKHNNELRPFHLTKTIIGLQLTFAKWAFHVQARKLI